MLGVVGQQCPLMQSLARTAVEQALHGLELGVIRFGTVWIDHGFETLPPVRADLSQRVRIQIPGLGDQQPFTVSEKVIYGPGRRVCQDGLASGGGDRSHDHVHRCFAQLGCLQRLGQDWHIGGYHGGSVQCQRRHGVRGPGQPGLRLATVDPQEVTQVFCAVPEGTLSGRDAQHFLPKLVCLENPVSVPSQGGPGGVDGACQRLHAHMQLRQGPGHRFVARGAHVV